MSEQPLPQVDIAGLNKVDVLIALYGGARPKGLGCFDEAGAGGGTLSREEARAEIEGAQRTLSDGRVRIRLDYVKGRVIKTDIGGETLSPLAYDRDNGAGAAEAAIGALRSRLTGASR